MHRTAAVRAAEGRQRAMSKAIHYAGGLQWTKGRTKTIVLPEWAACCSGQRARNIAEEGNQTYDVADVACKACLLRLVWAMNGSVRP